MFWRFFRRERMKPHAPSGVRVYAVGDIHGAAELVDQVLRKIDEDRGLHPVEKTLEIFLGDYIDRGPDSRGAIDRLIARAEERPCIFLLGNHELELLEFIKKPQRYRKWKSIGGVETLLSYGVEPTILLSTERPDLVRDRLVERMPERHVRFFSKLNPSVEIGDYFFVHAGVRPGVGLKEQSMSDLLTIRKGFLESNADFGKVVVHGHTPVERPEVHPNRIAIDTGAYVSGRLSCAVLENDQTRFLATGGGS